MKLFLNIFIKYCLTFLLILLWPLKVTEADEDHEPKLDWKVARIARDPV